MTLLHTALEKKKRNIFTNFTNNYKATSCKTLNTLYVKFDLILININYARKLFDDKHV